MIAALDDLTATLAALPKEFDALDNDTLETAVHRLAMLQTTVQSVWLSALRLAEERALHRRTGARDTATWAAGVAGERRGAAARDVALAGQLADAPLVAEAMASGTVSKAKTVELVRAAVLPDAVQAALVAEAAHAPVEQVAASVRRACLDHGVTDTPVTPAMTITRTADRARLDATVDLVDAELIEVAVDAAAEALKLPAHTTTAERRARGLVALARHYLEHAAEVPTGRLGRPHIVVLVDLEILEARTGGSALLASGAVITGDQARRLAADANITRVITQGASQPLDVGRSTRTVPPPLAKAVIARDRHCKYSGCSAPPWACDIHHRVPWANLGITALTNLGLLCWYHHDHIHRLGPERLTETDDGTWTIGPPQPERVAA